MGGVQLVVSQNLHQKGAFSGFLRGGGIVRMAGLHPHVQNFLSQKKSVTTIMTM